MRFHKLSITTAILATLSTTAFAAIEPGYITPHDSNLQGSNVVYQYEPNNQFKVRGKLQYLTDIVLGRNEKLTSIVAGNTEDWKVSSAVVDQTPHIYLKPVVKDAKTTNLIANTNKRSYRFIVREDEFYDDVVSFNNLNDSTSTATTLHHQDISTTINTDYEYVKAKNVYKSLIPTRIYDDGVKTYIDVPTNVIRNLPVVYKVNKKNKVSIVNSRLINHTIIIDTVLPRLQLRYNTDSYITVINHKEVGKKPVNVKELNAVLNKMSDISRGVNNIYVDRAIEAVSNSIATNELVNKEEDTKEQQSIPDKPIIIIHRDGEVEREVAPQTKEESHSIIDTSTLDSITTIDGWVPLKERIANLQKQARERGTRV